MGGGYVETFLLFCGVSGRFFIQESLWEVAIGSVCRSLEGGTAASYIGTVVCWLACVCRYGELADLLGDAADAP